jgi:hypothetical protein
MKTACMFSTTEGNVTRGSLQIMKCFECKFEMPDGSKFCSNCGKNFQIKTKLNQNEGEIQRSNLWPHQESKDVYNRILLGKKSTFAKIRQFLWFLILLGFVYFYISQGQSWHNYEFIIIAGLVFLVFLIQPKRLSSVEYYRIPYSRGDDGKHRCIWCGSRGIYKHGEYKTDNVYHDCSKCGVGLY